MPGFVKTKNDEKKWSEAKEASGKETEKGSKGYWKLSNFIFHKMKKSQGIEKAEELFKALKFDHPAGYVPSGEKAPQFKEPAHADHKKPFKGSIDSEVTHVKPAHHESGTDTVYLKTGHVSHGHKPGKFKVGDKVNAKQHIMGTHILDHKKSQGIEKAEEFAKILSPKPAPTSVANPMKAGEQTTISKTPKAPGMFKSEDFKDVKHTSARKLRDFMANNRGKKK